MFGGWAGVVVCLGEGVGRACAGAGREALGLRGCTYRGSRRQGRRAGGGVGRAPAPHGARPAAHQRPRPAARGAHLRAVDLCESDAAVGLLRVLFMHRLGGRLPRGLQPLAPVAPAGGEGRRGRGSGRVVCTRVPIITCPHALLTGLGRWEEGGGVLSRPVNDDTDAQGRRSRAVIPIHPWRCFGGVGWGGVGVGAAAPRRRCRARKGAAAGRSPSRERALRGAGVGAR